MTDLKESGALQAAKVSGHRYRARLIEGDRWGSSGYYPAKVLERDGPNVWPEGTPVYLDHPTEREDWERPERSVRDLAGKITTTPVYESDGLYAEVEFYPHTAPVLEALWADVGMSIRASGTTESGTRDGRSGKIITSLSEGLSVDVVTRAGAGGKLVALLESARGENRPPEPPGPSGAETQESNQRKDANMGTIQISEADHKALTDKAGRVEQLEADLAESNRKLEEAEGKPFPPKGGSGGEGGSELDRLRKENAALKAEIAELRKAKAKEARRTEVAGIVEEAFEHINAPGMKTRLIDQLTESDKDKDTIATEAKEAADELRTLGAGDGQVRGLGESRPADTTQTNVSESELPSWEELATMKGA